MFVLQYVVSLLISMTYFELLSLKINAMSTVLWHLRCTMHILCIILLVYSIYTFQLL